MILLVNSEKTNLYIEHFNKSLSGEYNIVKNREETYHDFRREFVFKKRRN